MLAAVLISHWFESTAFVFMIGLAFFGGPFLWIMILVTHLAFRRANSRAARPILRFAPPGPWSSLFGLVCLIGVLISTWWVPGFRITLLCGPPWLLFISLCYLVWSRARSHRPVAGTTKDG